MSTAPVRILYVDGYEDGVGRSSRSLLSLLEHLDRTRFDSVLVLPGESPLVPRFEADAGQVRVIKRRPPFQGEPPLAPGVQRLRGMTRVTGALRTGVNAVRFCASVVWLSDVIRREDAQAVHLNDSISNNYDWILAALLARVPCVAYEHRLHQPYSAMALWCRRRLARIICISQAVFDELVRAGVRSDRLVLIHSGLDPASSAARTMAVYEEALREA